MLAGRSPLPTLKTGNVTRRFAFGGGSPTGRGGGSPAGRGGGIVAGGREDGRGRLGGWIRDGNPLGVWEREGGVRGIGRRGVGVNIGRATDDTDCFETFLYA